MTFLLHVYELEVLILCLFLIAFFEASREVDQQEMVNVGKLKKTSSFTLQKTKRSPKKGLFQ